MAPTLFFVRSLRALVGFRFLGTTSECCTETTSFDGSLTDGIIGDIIDDWVTGITAYAGGRQKLLMGPTGSGFMWMTSSAEDLVTLTRRRRPNFRICWFLRFHLQINGRRVGILTESAHNRIRFFSGLIGDVFLDMDHVSSSSSNDHLIPLSG